MITVIIPTLCETRRRQSLLGAIESVRLASAQPVQILVVVNGQSFDAGLLALLRAQSDLEVLQIAEASLTKAHLAGRVAVTTEFYSFLDDDDEYLPYALDFRLNVLKQDKTMDLVVTNGYACQAGIDQLMYSRLQNVSANPLKEIFSQNWLHNCNHLFRSSSIPVKYFEDPHPYMEWTWLGFRLALDGKKIASRSEPTFRYNDSPDSLSKSPRFVQSRVVLYSRMLGQFPDRITSQLIRRRMSAAWHDVSVVERVAGNRAKAIRAHIQSLTCHWIGLRYLSYSRHVLF
ncbi:MAG: glycosyltransferase family A protein [Azonexus sp.]|nr:glycosyltransferase family A protein [Azonexus sp.]